MVNLFWADEEGLPGNDRGLAYGDGLFETIGMQGRHGHLLGRHLERMVRDAGRLGLSVSRAELQAASVRAVDRFAEQFGEQAWVLKLTLTRGAGGRGYRPEPGTTPNLLVAAAPAPQLPTPEGVNVELSSVPLTVNPLLAGIKSLNRLEQVMAARELGGSVFEVIMSNSEGHLIEGTRTNLLLVNGQGWVTPPAGTLAVAGVMRQWVIERLREQGEPVLERSMTIADVLDPDCRGLYLLNSVLGIVPVRRVADHDLPVDGRLATICSSFETLE